MNKGVRTTSIGNAKTRVPLIGNIKGEQMEFYNMDKDVIKADRGLVFEGYGEYLLNGIFVTYGTNLEAC
jgi:hypothetical protein